MRLLTALTLAFALAAIQFSHAAAATLENFSVTQLPGGGVRVILTAAGGIPANYRVAGAGSSTLLFTLPATTLGQVVQVSYPPAPGTGFGGAAVSMVGSDTYLRLNLSEPVQVAMRRVINELIIDIPPLHSASQNRENITASGAGQSTGASTVTEVIPLSYADVSEVAGILTDGQIPPNDTFTAAGSIFGLPTSVNGAAAAPQQISYAGSQAQALSFGQRVSDNISVDRRLNAVIVTGTRDQVDAIKAKIATIDVPLSSVILECQIVELSESGAHDIGLDYSTAGQLATVSATAKAGEVPTGEIDFAARVFAAVAKGGGRILATPRVLALNGHLASILSGDALPIITTTTIPGPPVLVQQTVNYIAVGVNLQIQPRISSTGNITSHIFAEVSSVTAFIATPQGQVPQISLRQATTEATVKDGQPFVVGGLLRDEEISNMSRVPGLGDLPLIGSLFRVRHDTLTRTNLFIVVTPRLIHHTGLGEPGALPADLPKPIVPGPTPSP